MGVLCRLNELFLIQSRQLSIEARHHLQIMRYRAQLGGAAQLQLNAFIEIEGRRKVIGLNPDEITGRGRFNQQQRVNHLGGVGIFQKPLTFEPVSADEIRVGEPAEKLGHFLLQRDVESAVDLQVKPVEIVEIRDAERLHHAVANCVGSLVLTRRGLWRQWCGRKKADRSVLEFGCELSVDDAGARHQARELADFFFQRRSFLDQKHRRRAHRNEQRQNMLEGPHFRRRPTRRIQRRHDVIEAHAEPGVQGFAETVDLTVARRRGQRHGVEIIDNDPLAPGAGIGAFAIGFQACADDLAKLLHRCVRAAVG